MTKDLAGIDDMPGTNDMPDGGDQSGGDRDHGALTGHSDHVRLVEAVLFSSPSPVKPDQLRALLPADADLDAIIDSLATLYANRGIVLIQVAGGFAFRTAPDLTPHLKDTRQVFKKPSRAALETLAIVAYHQPVTRAEIEELRGVATNKGTIDALIQAGWIKPGGRRRTPGRPLTWVTTEAFLAQFDLGSLDDLPALEELKAAGLLDRAGRADQPPGASDENGHETSDF